MPTPAVTNKVYEQGNNTVLIAKLNADGTYGAVTQINGMMSFSGSLSRTITKKSAEDNPAYLVMQGSLIGTAELTLIGLKTSDYSKLFSVEAGTNGGVVLGTDMEPTEIGLSFLTTVKDMGTIPTTSINKTSYLRCIASVPSKPTDSIAEDGSTITEVKISLEILPYFYTVGGVQKKATYTVYNSVDDTAIWATIKDTIALPTAAAV